MRNKVKILVMNLVLCFLIFSLVTTAFSGSHNLINKDDTVHVINKSSGTQLLLWNTTWGGTLTEYGRGVAIDTAGNVYYVGSTNSYGAGVYDLALVKFYPNGTKAWNSTWG